MTAKRLARLESTAEIMHNAGMSERIYEHFLGTWVLDTATCDYEQGEPPWAETHRIEDQDGDLVITMECTDADGERQSASFRAPADGRKVPFDARPLADALQISTPTETELNTSAFRDGVELMTARRTLSLAGETLELAQTVHLPDGTAPTNHGTYYRQM